MKTLLTLLVILSFERTLLAEEKGLYFPPAEGVWEPIEPTQVGWVPAKLKASSGLCWAAEVLCRCYPSGWKARFRAILETVGTGKDGVRES
jgi:hypothetical protein